MSYAILVCPHCACAVQLKTSRYMVGHVFDFECVECDELFQFEKIDYPINLTAKFNVVKQDKK